MTPRRSEFRRPAGLLALVLVGLASRAAADTITLAPTKDNTLFESATGALSNGAGPGLYVGRTAAHGVRRAVLRFPVDANVEAGSTILSVQLVLSMNKTQVGAVNIDLHRVLADWGQGTSFTTGGAGAASTTGDATWIHRFFGGATWTTPGGDFAPAASATRSVGASGSYTWGSTAAMVADVQAWLDTPAANFGWILIGPEGGSRTAKRFDSLESSPATVRPKLLIEFRRPVPVEPTAWSTVKSLYKP